MSSTEDNHGAGGVPISGPSRSTRRGHPRMRRLSLVLATHISGIFLAIINKNVRKKGTPSDRVGLDKRHVAEGSEALPWQEEGVLTRYDDEELTMQEIGQIHTKAILHVHAALHA